jgi:hypothetical protein
MDKRWWLIDDCTTAAAACWEQPLQVETKEEAVKEARRRWESLTKHDQDKRDNFYVCLCRYDEEGLIDLETMEECENIK